MTLYQDRGLAVPQGIPLAELVEEHSAAAAPPAGGLAADPAAHAQTRAVGWRGWVATVIFIALCDVTIYHGHGFLGIAALALVAPLVFWYGIGAVRPGRRWGTLGVEGLVLLSAARLAWQGSGGLVAATVLLLMAFAMSAHGLRPYVIDIVVFALRSWLDGIISVVAQVHTVAPLRFRASARIAAVLLPVVVCTIFAAIFTLANPDLARSVGRWLQQVADGAFEWLNQFSPWQLLFWMLTGIVGFGILSPRTATYPIFASGETLKECRPLVAASMYRPICNTLWSVNGLFLVYLVFEFATLWFRVFPKGFHYSGYAHEGAAWLTFALALSTIVLSFTVRGEMLRDPRVARLRKLAACWSALNYLLAVAVYHRMLIYVGFNGMTRMRVVGLLGITCVVLGFSLLLWKISRNRDFVWLLQRQVWALALHILLYLVVPVDVLVHVYNVHRVLGGDPAPAVQITEHPVSSEGCLVLPPLISAPDETIREGMLAFLAERQVMLSAEQVSRNEKGWTARQAADEWLETHLESLSDRWQYYLDDSQARELAIRRFREYAYQWY